MAIVFSIELFCLRSPGSIDFLNTKRKARKFPFIIIIIIIIWGNMIIRVDKCVTFGIRKSVTKSVQFHPKLLINHDLVLCVKTGASFTGNKTGVKRTFRL